MIYEIRNDIGFSVKMKRKLFRATNLVVPPIAFKPITRSHIIHITSGDSHRFWEQPQNKTDQQVETAALWKRTPHFGRSTFITSILIPKFHLYVIGAPKQPVGLSSEGCPRLEPRPG